MILHNVTQSLSKLSLLEDQLFITSLTWSPVRVGLCSFTCYLSTSTFHIRLNYIFFCFVWKWRNVVQRLNEVCFVAASQKDKLMDNFVTKVCSLPPTIPPLRPMAQQTWSLAVLSLSSAKPGRGKYDLWAICHCKCQCAYTSETISNQSNLLFCK